MITHNVCGLCFQALSEQSNDTKFSRNSALFRELLTRNSCCKLCDKSITRAGTAIVTHKPKDYVCSAVLLMLSSYRHRCSHQLWTSRLLQQNAHVHAIWIKPELMRSPTRLYRCARVVSNLVRNISTKCLSCLNSQKQACRQLYDPSGQGKTPSERFGG